MKTIEINRHNLAFWKNRLSKHTIALGFFDGLHKGHQRVIKTAKDIAKSNHTKVSVMSFFPHPKSVLSDGNVKVDYLMPLEEKKKRLKQIGVNYFFIVKFDKEFASLSPEQFVKDYLIDLGAVHAVCGFDYTYGHRGIGDVYRLKLDSDNRLEVTVVPKVEFYGEKISSTLIRELLAKKKVNYIKKLLGRPYQVEWSKEKGVLPYYTLPAPGRYYVNIQGVSWRSNCIISVTDNQQLIMNEPSFFKDEQLLISWHYQVKSELCRAIS